MGTPNFFTPSSIPLPSSAHISFFCVDVRFTIARGVPPIAAISFTFTSTAQYPAHHGSAFNNLPQIPSTASKTKLSLSTLSTAASSPNPIIVRLPTRSEFPSLFTRSLIALFRFTPSKFLSRSASDSKSPPSSALSIFIPSTYLFYYFLYLTYIIYPEISNLKKLARSICCFLQR